jgi:hypothetical protein
MNQLSMTLLGVCVTLSLSLAGCSGDDDDDSGSGGTGGSSAGTGGHGGSSGTGGTSSTAGTGGSNAFDADQFCSDLCECVGQNNGDAVACAGGCPDDVAGGATREICADRLNAAEDGVEACVPVCDALPSR